MRRPPARLTRCVLSAVCCGVLAVTLDAQGQGTAPDPSSPAAEPKFEVTSQPGDDAWQHARSPYLRPHEPDWRFRHTTRIHTRSDAATSTWRGPSARTHLTLSQSG